MSSSRGRSACPGKARTESMPTRRCGLRLGDATVEGVRAQRTSGDPGNSCGRCGRPWKWTVPAGSTYAGEALRRGLRSGEDVGEGVRAQHTGEVRSGDAAEEGVRAQPDRIGEALRNEPGVAVCASAKEA
mmetsp:Transcript_111417/g.359629  ORF Transcript_111417/g.359629 Transcript_111417/m.359629 type:complete len:130 (+) Transcript_111417:160-549(+)